MLDSRSLEVISRFKLALLTRSQNTQPALALPVSNRGKKLAASGAKTPALALKVVEYDGANHLVLTNDAIERSNYAKKRRWLDYVRAENGSKDDDYSSDEDAAAASDSDDEHPLQKLSLGEILAPLAHPAELVTHPAISKTYRLGCLATLALDLINLIEVEQNTLNSLNKLLQVLAGEDWFYQLEENMEIPEYDHGLDEAVSAKIKAQMGTEPAPEDDKDDGENGEFKRVTRMAKVPEGKILITDPFFALPKTLALFEAQQQKQLEDAEDDGDELQQIQQDLINYLQVSIQRQHEYVSNLTTIRNGIVKADKYKGELLRWGKEMNEKKS